MCPSYQTIQGATAAAAEQVILRVSRAQPPVAAIHRYPNRVQALDPRSIRWLGEIMKRQIMTFLTAVVRWIEIPAPFHGLTEAEAEAYRDRWI